MPAAWVIEEMKSVNLHDQRLNERLVTVLSQLSERPTASIPAACGGHAELTAADRLFDNENTTFERILAPHAETTRLRIAAQPVAILAQDTTEVDLTRPEQTVRGAGPLGRARVGARLHVLHGFTPDGTPLGSLSAVAWARDVAQRCPSTQCICVADSEADIYELLLEGTAESGGLGWIVRGCQDRALSPEKAGETAVRHLHEQALTSAALFTQTISVRGRRQKIACDQRGRRQARESRQAEVSVRAATVTLRPPWRADGKLPEVTVNVVLVREEQPPENDEPVEWLLTNLPINTLDAVRQVIQHYCVRWMIEVFFRVLKSGCRVEERRFETLDRLLNCLATYLITAWRTLYVCRLGRSCPEISCEAVFEPAEWQAAWKVVRREDPPKQPPSLGVMVRLVAQLGGYVPRPRSDPGPQTIWLGLQRVQDFALCWITFGPGAPKQLELV